MRKKQNNPLVEMLQKELLGKFNKALDRIESSKDTINIQGVIYELEEFTKDPTDGDVLFYSKVERKLQELKSYVANRQENSAPNTQAILKDLYIFKKDFEKKIGNAVGFIDETLREYLCNVLSID